MKHRLHWIAGAMIVLAGCQPPRPVPQPQARSNPAPVERYEVAITLRNDPGDIRRATGTVGYTIANDECVPIDHARSLGGSKSNFRISRDLTVVRTGQVFSTVVLKDLLQPQDYYGKGVCRWRVNGISISLHRKGVTNRVIVPSDPERVAALGADSQRCPYRGNPVSSDGVQSCSFRTAPIRGDYFSVEIKIKEN